MALNPVTPILIPAEFQDRLSDQLLLQPDPEYLFARWLFSAAVQGQAEDLEGYDLAISQVREGRALPPASATDTDMEEAMAGGQGGTLLVSRGMAFPDMVKMVMDPSKPIAGETIKINRPRYVDGDTTESNRKISPSSTLFGTNSQPIAYDQVDVTVYEYVGPTDASGNKAPLSFTSFALNRSAHDILRNMGYQLRRDRYRFADDLAMTRLVAACNAQASYAGITLGGGIASGSAKTALTGNENEPLDYATIVHANEAMRSRFIPGVMGGKYVHVYSTHQLAQLKLDPGYRQLSVFQPEFNPLFPGYVSTVENAIICEGQRLPTLSTGIGGATKAYQGLVIAPGVLGWACAMNATTLRNKNDDGGRMNEFGWHSFEGIECLNNQFAQIVVTD